MTKEELWAIGLFEGEGCIFTNQRTKGTTVGMTLETTDEDVIERFVQVVKCGHLYGPLTRNGRNCKPYWRWAVGRRDDTVALLERWLPELGQRRAERAREVIEIARTTAIRKSPRSRWGKAERGL